jgi:two-component system alkaline phosphatase synthesis response regulator PhoP
MTKPDILEILKYNLSNEGYDVITAKDGDEALEKARRTQPDLVVLDVMMPKKNRGGSLPDTTFTSCF